MIRGKIIIILGSILVYASPLDSTCGPLASQPTKTIRETYQNQSENQLSLPRRAHRSMRDGAIELCVAYFSAKDREVLQRGCFPRQSCTSSGETANRSAFQQDGIASATNVKLLAPRRIKQFACAPHRSMCEGAMDMCIPYSCTKP